MITAVDSNVLLDIFEPSDRFGPASSQMLRECLSEGAVVACEIVWSEVCSAFETIAQSKTVLEQIGIEFSPLDEATALSAGHIWKTYRGARGSRQRLIPDFLVGAHAANQADRLLTRDRGFYRSLFQNLRILEPH